MTALAPMPQKEVVPIGQIVSVSWELEHAPPVHEFSAIACPEEEGGYSIFAADYPGVVSQGETLEEAEANIAEAFLAMLEASRNHNEPLAHSRDAVMAVSANCKRLRIRVDG